MLAEEAHAGRAPLLFGFEATKAGEQVMRLGVFAELDGSVLVKALIWNTKSLDQPPPARFRRPFKTVDAAKTFADETAVCLEYVGCTINPLTHSSTA